MKDALLNHLSFKLIVFLQQDIDSEDLSLRITALITAALNDEKPETSLKEISHSISNLGLASSLVLFYFSRLSIY